MSFSEKVGLVLLNLACLCFYATAMLWATNGYPSQIELIARWLIITAITAIVYATFLGYDHDETI